MPEQTEHDLSDVPTDDDALPASVRPGSRDGDAWYEYRGERLFEPARILDLWDRYQEMDETEWDRVASLKGSSSTRLKVRTKDVEELREALDERGQEVNEDFGFMFQLSTLTTPHHGIHEEGPRKSVAWACYQAGGRAFMGGAKYKRSKLLKPVRSFEQYIYHNRVWLPTVEPYHEKYPY